VSSQDLILGRRFPFQQDNDPKHTAKTMHGWLRDKSLIVLEWLCQSPDLNPIEHLWRDLKKAVHRRSPSNLTELERICRDVFSFSLWGIVCRLMRKKTIESILE
jgi:hypothetical protein